MAKAHYKEAITDKQKEAFSQFLAEDEEIVLISGYGQTYLRSLFIMAMMWPGLVLFALGLGAAYYFHIDPTYGFFAGLIGMILIGVLKAVHTNHANRYLLTTKRVLVKKGVFAVQITSALYDKVTHIEVDQSFWDKILMHHGTIKVNTAGTNKDEIILKYVDYPIEFKNLLERLINREREMFGLRSGTIPTVEGELL